MWWFVLGYLKDVVIFWRSVEEDLDHLWTLQELLSRDNVSLRLNKRFFVKDEIDYLGHEVRRDRLGRSTKSTDAICEPQQPTNLTELKSFLRLCDLYRRSVPSVIRIAAPLNCKLEKD